MKINEKNKYQNTAADYFDKAGIVLSDKERDDIEIADFGLGKFEEIGLSIVTYVNTDRVCAKELVLLPGQTCPEHLHPDLDTMKGKEETFRCRMGKVFLYVSGDLNSNYLSVCPQDDSLHFTAGHEIILEPGDQYTLRENTLHWFKAGDDGAVISEFSTRSCDEADIFTDPRIKRIPQIEQ